MKKNGYYTKISDYDNPKNKEHLTKNTTYGEIPYEWRVSLLKDVSIRKGGVQTGPFGSQLHQKDYKHVGTPIITVEHLGENRIIHENLPLVSDEDHDRLSRYTLKEGDIVFSRVGSVDRRAFVKKKEEGWLFSGRCLRVRPDPKIVDPSYLSWFFGHPNFIDYIRRIAVGATMPSLNTNLLESVEIILPPIDEQKKIASILDSLNEKIELNHHINFTLEKIAQTIFKHWFIDFEFPDENGDPYRSRGGRMVDSELGMIPEGWDVKTIDSVAKKVAMGPFGSNIKVSTFVEKGVPIISGQHLNETLLTESSYNYITEEHARKLANSCVSSGDLIFTHAGNIGQVSLIPSTTKYPKYIISQRQFYLRPDTKQITSSYLVYFFRSHTGQHLLLANASQVGVPSISRPSSYLKSIKIIVPGKTVLKQFETIIEVFAEQIVNNKEEVESLAKIRDSLLPKLMSGKIRVG